MAAKKKAVRKKVVRRKVAKKKVVKKKVTRKTAARRTPRKPVRQPAARPKLLRVALPAGGDIRASLTAGGRAVVMFGPVSLERLGSLVDIIRDRLGGLHTTIRIYDKPAEPLCHEPDPVVSVSRQEKVSWVNETSRTVRIWFVSMLPLEGFPAEGIELKPCETSAAYHAKADTPQKKYRGKMFYKVQDVVTKESSSGPPDEPVIIVET